MEKWIALVVSLALILTLAACRGEPDDTADLMGLTEISEAMMGYLGCPCQYFPPMEDDGPIMEAYDEALHSSDGSFPMLVVVDEGLWQCLLMNSDPDSMDAGGFSFDPERVAGYREAALSGSLEDGAAVLAARIARAKADETAWEDLLGEMEGGERMDRFSAYRDLDTGMVRPVILAKIPVEHPWEVFAYLPFGGWNECPDTAGLMAVAKYWSERYGAVPAVMSSSELEFCLPAPVPEEEAMELALEIFGFCPDVVYQGPGDSTVGWLADTLRQSDKWYCWWD